MRSSRILSLLFLSLILSVPLSSMGRQAPQLGNSNKMRSASESIKELENIGIDERVGEMLDPNIQLINAEGKEVLLKDYLSLGKPLLLSPIYFGCPGLCNFHLNGLVEGLAEMSWTAGQEYEVLVFSFDAKETPELGKTKKEFYMEELYKRPEGDAGFHFHTATQENIDRLTSAIGFKFEWNEEGQEWMHASAAVVLTPEGKISRYLHGIIFEPQTVQLALNEAGDGKVGTIVDKVMLYCFKWDSSQSKFTLAAFRVVKLGGGLTILVLAAWLIPFWIRARREEV